MATRPELIDGIGARVLSWVNSVRGKPADTGLTKWRETLSQLESVQLGRRDLGVAFSWSLFNWIADVGCLLFACYATGGHPSLAGVTVAYAAARAVGSIPLMPGGLLVVEAVLVPGLVSSGMSLASAISAMLIYRLVSWIFIAAIGWVVFFFMFRTEKDIDPDSQADETASADDSRRHAIQPRPRSSPPTGPQHRIPAGHLRSMTKDRHSHALSTRHRRDVARCAPADRGLLRRQRRPRPSATSAAPPTTAVTSTPSAAPSGPVGGDPAGGVVFWPRPSRCPPPTARCTSPTSCS